MTLKNRTPFYPVLVNQKIRYLHMRISDPSSQILGHKGPPTRFFLGSPTPIRWPCSSLLWVVEVRTSDSETS